MRTNLPRVLMTLLVGLVLGGCACAGPTTRPIAVTLDPELRGSSFRTIEVDLVFVQANELQRWREKDIIEYFSGGDVLRADQRRVHRMVFAPDGPAEQSFGYDRTELELMGQWIRDGATHLFVMAKLPNHERIGASTGASDPRRQCLPLSQCDWEEAGVEPQDLRVSLRRGSVELSPGIPCN